MILTKPEAQAVYRAMCELNDIGALAHFKILNRDNTTTHVREYVTDEVCVWVGDYYDDMPDMGARNERFTSQSVFASTYSL